MELARHWRLRNARYRMEGSRDTTSGTVHFPPHPGPNRTPHTLSGNGTVMTYAVVHAPPAGYEGAAPYVVALIALDDGPRLTAQLTDVAADEVAIGMQVEMVTRRMADTGADGLLLYAYKFRPVL
ncbi:MAG: hypothetical protein RLZZ297_1048 [Chloroflexota bacterium]|jgi:uncharacterized OB-fold protein